MRVWRRRLNHWWHETVLEWWNDRGVDWLFALVRVIPVGPNPDIVMKGGRWAFMIGLAMFLAAALGFATGTVSTIYMIAGPILVLVGTLAGLAGTYRGVMNNLPAVMREETIAALGGGASLHDRVTEAMMAINTHDEQADALLLALFEEIADESNLLSPESVLASKSLENETPADAIARSGRTLELLAATERLARIATVMPRQAVASALARIAEALPDQRILDALAACREASPEAVSSNKNAFVGNKADIPTVAQHISLLAVEHPPVVCAALRAIADQCSYRYDPSIFVHMQRCATHPSPAVRCAVLLMMHSPCSYDNVFDPEFVDIALRLASDPDVNVRMEACRVLSSYPVKGRADAAQALFGLISDSHEHTRSWALIALAELQDPRSVDIIEEKFRTFDAQFNTEPPPEMLSEWNVLYEAIRHFPNQRYLPYLQRWARQATDDGVGNFCDELIQVCKRPARTKAA
jgi:hypothetical protein